jgi:hypothetical protein
MMINFESLIGKTIPIMIPIISPNDLLDVIIRGVEAGGIWIESEKMTQHILTSLAQPALKTPVFFVPYHEIKFAYYATESLALSEKAFSV